MAIDGTNTFEHDEITLLLAERELIKDFIDSEAKIEGADYIRFRERANKLAEDWKRYAMRPIRDGKTPKVRVAVKHGVALLNFPANQNQIKKELEYGVSHIAENGPYLSESPETAEREKAKLAAYPVPILRAPEGGVFAVENFANGTCTALETHTLEIIAGCNKCPAGGLCEISSKCTSYKEGEYRASREKKGVELGPENPTADDYRTFNNIRISRKK